MNESTYLAAIHQLPGISQQHLRKGLSLAQGSAARFWGDLSSILTSLGVGAQQRVDQLQRAKNLSLERIAEKLQREGIQVLTEGDEYFPFPKGVEMQGRPYLLYVKGEAKALGRESISIVGARKITPYGERVLQYIVPYLVQSGFVVTSGLAKGVDGMAHKQTIVNGGQTIAVVGTGIDVIYPTMHRGLESEIVQKNGCCISEFPLGAKPLKWNFPLRNRLIARLPRAVIVVEAGSASGSIRTAEWALVYNTPVYVVPGSIFSEQSMGANELLGQGQEGIRVLSKREDILECTQQASLSFGGGYISETDSSLTKELRIFAEFLHDEPQSVADISKKTGLSIPASLSALGRLELYDAAKETPNGWVKYGVYLTS